MFRDQRWNAKENQLLYCFIKFTLKKQFFYTVKKKKKRKGYLIT